MEEPAVKSKRRTSSPNNQIKAETIEERWPSRTMRVTGPNLDAKCRWECKYDNWFCMSTEKPIRFMAFPDAFTIPRLAELKRRGLECQWLE